MSIAIAPRHDADEELPYDPEKLDSILYSLSRVRTVTERILGQGLLRLMQNEGLLRLGGYVKLGDYVNQRLGIGERFAQELCTLEARLPSYPLLQAAYQQGLLSKSKVRALLTGIGPEEEAEWVQRAQTLTVRKLNAELKAKKRKATSLEDSSLPCIRPVDADLHPETRGRWVCMEATAELSVKWQVACEVERRRAGHDLPNGLCLEAFLAEFFSSLAAADVLGEVADEVERMLAEYDAFQALRTRTRERRMEAAERRSENWTGLPRTVLHALPPAELLAPLPDDPFAIDRRLRDIVAYRQRHSHRFMEAMTWFKRHGGYSQLGFRNFHQYAVERLGMSRRCVDSLVWIFEQLKGLPQIAGAFFGGHIHQTQAELLARVASKKTESRWLSFARSVPTRRLREEIQTLADRAALAQLTETASLDMDGEWEPPLSDVTGARQSSAAARDGGAACNSGGGVAPASAACVTSSESSSSLSAPSFQHGQMRAPHSTCRLRFWLPREVEPLWLQAQVVCQALFGGTASQTFALETVLDNYLDEYLPVYRHEMKSHPILHRDGFMCAVPTCTSRKNLHDHHYVFRSHGGGDEPTNRGAVCQAHHLRGIHRGRIVVSGQAPDHLTWLLGVRQDGPPHLSIGPGGRIDLSR